MPAPAPPKNPEPVIDMVRALDAYVQLNRIRRRAERAASQVQA
jgi:hypothetical protein